VSVATARKPRPRLEKHEQAAIVRLLRSVGATVYTLGTTRPRTDSHHGTRQTPGLPDLLAFIPTGRDGYPRALVAVEVKRAGGDAHKKRSPEQREFAALCADADVAYICGTIDAVLALLQARGLVRP
jgi:hypothetical protein